MQTVLQAAVVNIQQLQSLSKTKSQRLPTDQMLKLELPCCFLALLYFKISWLPQSLFPKEYQDGMEFLSNQPTVSR